MTLLEALSISGACCEEFMQNSNYVVIGAGPAGLTAALELLRKGYTNVTVVEMSSQVGGISRTHIHHGNRMDIGGHRFFSKSENVMRWWADILPVEGQGMPPLSAESCDRIILQRNRLSRIFYIKKFFSYPISLNMATLKNLGFTRVVKIGCSYIKAMLFPIKHEKTLEDFIVNRFGRALYETFFRDYTYKVWGVPCNKIAADWGAQRIKGLSVTRVLAHAIKKFFSSPQSIEQKNVETSLIERFWYPKLGPGSLWEAAAEEIQKTGGRLIMEARATGLLRDARNGHITGVSIRHADGRTEILHCDHCITSMPLSELIEQLGDSVPASVREVARGLVYRDFMTVGVLLKKLNGDTDLKDNWIYIQEPDVHVGRLQLFHNWSPWLLQNPDKRWLGMEYFATEGDALWNLSDEEMISLAIRELEKLGFAKRSDVEDAVLLRVPKAYPAYFGTYARIKEIQEFIDTIPNLWPVGRNGMHRYNNMDHSMLTAMETVKYIDSGKTAKRDIWKINSESAYHESK